MTRKRREAESMICDQTRLLFSTYRISTLNSHEREPDSLELATEFNLRQPLRIQHILEQVD